MYKPTSEEVEGALDTVTLYKIKGDSVGTPSILIRTLIEQKVKQGWRP